MHYGPKCQMVTYPSFQGNITLVIKKKKKGTITLVIHAQQLAIINILFQLWSLRYFLRCDTSSIVMRLCEFTIIVDGKRDQIK